MNKSIFKTLSDSLFSFYVYFSTVLLGWQLVSFIYLYQSTNAKEIIDRFDSWIGFQPYFIGIGAVTTIVLLIVHRISPIIQLQHIQGLPKQILIQNIFLIIIFLNYLTFLLGIHLDVFELISFIFAIWVLVRWGNVFYHTNLIFWRHPTTHGSFFIGSLLIGCALFSMFGLVGLGKSGIYIIILILLAFDLLIVFGRFQFLTKSGETTKVVARNLLGSQLLFFGSRIIIGIFMPGIFIIYMIFITGEEIKGVELLILVGTLIDRFLFINSTNLRF